MARILIIDDDSDVCDLVRSVLEQQGYECEVAENADQAWNHLEAHDFELTLCDVTIPGTSGLELVKRLLKDYPNTAAVMITGCDDPALAEVALNFGAYGYVTKPFKPNELIINVANALRRRALEIENRHHRQQLETLVHDRTLALRNAIFQLEQVEGALRTSREDTIQRLSRAAEWRDDETASHINRMSKYCHLMAQLAGLNGERVNGIQIASPMHDIGKLGTPDHILLKPGRLNRDEFEIMQRHAEIGYRILSGSSSPLLALAASIAWTHHEKFDGSGYPKRLEGSDIPIEGRITAIADVFDALTTRRVYKEAFPIEKSLRIMKNGRGTHFDPDLLDLFMANADDFIRIREQNADPTRLTD